MLDHVREAIHRQVIYPPLARRLGWQGKTTVAFHLTAGGQVEHLRVLEIVMPIVFALR